MHFVRYTEFAIKLYIKQSFAYIQSFWLNILQLNLRFVYVCACVCVCISTLEPKRINPFWWNLPQMIWQISIIKSYSRFLKIRIWWHHSDHFICFGCYTLTVAILLLQIYRQETLLSSNVWYWKSAKSVNNFRSKKRTAFAKNRLFSFQAGVGGPCFES